jgi:CubicO group peptidase (beta-lactamase class C family)
MHDRLRKKSIAFSVFFSVALTSLIGCSRPPAPPALGNDNNLQAAIEYARDYLKHEMKKSGVVGLAVAVVDSDRVVYSEGFGYADKAAGKQVTPATTFMIGSISKLFTATAVMQLVEHEKIILDSPVTAYLPGFAVHSRFAARAVTVRDLLTHESGLPSDILNGFVLGQVRTPAVDTAYRCVPGLLANEYCPRPPRSVFAYCNLGFSLLGNVIEKVSGVSYADYMRDSVFAKLGMDSSAVIFDDPRVKGAFSRGYIGSLPVDAPYIRDMPAGSLVSSVSDLARFLRMINEGGSVNGRTILRDSTLERMWSAQNADIPLDLDFRVGLTFWLTNPSRAPGRIACHGGDIPPYHGLLAALPDAKLGVVVLVNSAQGSMLPNKAGLDLLEAFYEAKSGVRLPQRPTPPAARIAPDRLDSLTGFYATPMGLSRATRAGNRLAFTFAGLPVELIPESDSVFAPHFKLFGLFPLAEETFKPMRLTFHSVEGRKIMALRFFGLILGMGEKFVPQAPPPEWVARTGAYEVVNGAAGTFTDKKMREIYSCKSGKLTYNAGTQLLCLELRQIGQKSTLPLQALSTAEAITRGVGRGAGETIGAWTENGQEYLRFSGFVMKKAK